MDDDVVEQLRHLNELEWRQIISDRFPTALSVNGGGFFMGLPLPNVNDDKESSE